MLLVADECVDFSIIECLRKHDIEVYAIVEQDPSIIDEDVLNIAVRMGAPLITEDKDFGELVFRLKLPHRGIILLRLGNVPSEKKGELAARIILKHLPELPNTFAVFDGFVLRIRRD